jgi:hypothetical protein
MKVFGTALLILVGAALLEGWRLNTPEVIRLQETWDFTTALGNRRGSRTIEIRQYGAIPYLPGGATGRSRIIAGPLTLALPGETILITSEPQDVISSASKAGLA